MVRLQKQSSRKIGDKEYTKFVIVIPSEKVKEAGFSEGQELKIETKEGKIILRK